MNRISKSLAAFTILIIAISSLSLLMIKPVNAQSIPTPSVPKFSVKYVDNSYYVSSPSTIIDQYGNSMVVQGYVENKTVEFLINNQDFTAYTIPYNSSDPYNTGQTVNLMFNIRMKAHSENDSNWQYITHLSDGYLKQSDSNSTIASYQIENLFSMDIPNDEQIDFQVQALKGYVHRYPIINSWTFNGTESGWSNTQTLTIPAKSTSASPNPTLSSTPSIPELPSATILTLLLTATALSLVIYFKKHKRPGKLT